MSDKQQYGGFSLALFRGAINAAFDEALELERCLGVGRCRFRSRLVQLDVLLTELEDNERITEQEDNQ